MITLERQKFSDEEILKILTAKNGDPILEELRKKADDVRKEFFGAKVFVRGLIEFSSFCKNDCLYCGLRASNKNAVRYRLSKEEILECAKIGYEIGYRTFVLQGGEDLKYSDDDICGIVRSIKKDFPDCAVTLSIGEKSRETYQKYFDAGTDRYLLRHETASDEHYKKLHPENMSLENRKRCLFDLKEIGFQVGAGFMVGSPFQTDENIIEDLRFLEELRPAMIGIGPFIAHHETPFKDFESGCVEKTLRLISILRLMFPNALIPATTALGTRDLQGREKGLKAGANVVMPNLSPKDVRKFYEIYDNKICTGEEAAECFGCLSNRVKFSGYEIVVDRGDFKPLPKEGV